MTKTERTVQSDNKDTQYKTSRYDKNRLILSQGLK